MIEYKPPLNRQHEKSGTKILAETYWFYFEKFEVWIEINRGFRYNASVPRIARTFVSQNDLADVGDLIHDLMYRCKGDLWNGVREGFFQIWRKDKSRPLTNHLDLNYDRKYADWLWWKIGYDSGAERRAVNLAYSFVRMFGWFAW